MKLFRMLCVLFVAIFLGSAPVFAQAGAAAGGPDPARWKIALAAIGMGIASGLCGLGQGRAVASATEAIARNPGAVAAIRALCAQAGKNRISTRAIDREIRAYRRERAL